MALVEREQKGREKRKEQNGRTSKHMILYVFATLVTPTLESLFSLSCGTTFCLFVCLYVCVFLSLVLSLCVLLSLTLAQSFSYCFSL